MRRRSYGIRRSMSRSEILCKGIFKGLQCAACFPRLMAAVAQEAFSVAFHPSCTVASAGVGGIQRTQYMGTVRQWP